LATRPAPHESRRKLQGELLLPPRRVAEVLPVPRAVAARAQLPVPAGHELDRSRPRRL